MRGVDEFRKNNGYEQGMQGDHEGSVSPRSFYKHRSAADKHFVSVPSFMSRCTGRRSHGSSPDKATATLFKSVSRKSMDASAAAHPSKSANRFRSSGPIMFSNSMGLVKPRAIEKNLECTLEELCHGCIKKIKITRNAITNNGEMIQEEELLTIKVKPGWRSGTRITFEGMGDEAPGSLPGDITILIAEKWHPLFSREGNDLELAIEIPLVMALTGFNLEFPLLGGETMDLRIDEIICPGSVKIIEGQGMPNPTEQLRRGDLRIKFLVEFPTELTVEQRSDILSILQDSR